VPTLRVMAAPSTPPPLGVAASLVGLEGVALLAGAVVTLVDLDTDQLTLGLATTSFFAAYGAVLVAAGLSLARRRTWARGPALLSQLIMLGLAWNIRGGYLVPALVLALVAVVTVAGIVHPASVEALDPRGGPDDD